MLHLFFGAILMGLGVWGIVAWWNTFGIVMRGVVPFTLLVFGLIAVLAAFRRGSNAVATTAAADESESQAIDLRQRREAAARSATASR